MIYGYAQSFHCTPDYILHGISYQNLMLYGLASPSYDTDPDGWDDSIDANNPDNFNNDEEEITV